MKIVFYCAEEAPANFANYLKLGASGTVSALVLAANGLGRMGHEVVVLNRSESGVFGKARHIHTTSPDQIEGRIEEIGDVDVFIANGFASSVFFTKNINARKRACWIHNFVDQRPFEEAVQAGRLDYVICISRNQMGTWWRSPVFDRVAQIYNSVDIVGLGERVPDTGKEKKILFIGAPRKSKGFHDALRIFDAFSKETPGYRFYVAGSASLHGSNLKLSDNGIFEKDYEERHLKALLYGDDGQLRGDVVLLGKIPREEVLEHLRNSVAALQNPCWDSEPEVHSISAMEAQAMGVPVVTAFRGGQPEVVIDGKTGLLLKSPDVRAAAKALSALVSNPELLSRMSEEARRNIRTRFQVESVARDWNEQLSIMLKGGRFRGNLLKALRSKLRHKLRR